MGVDLAKCKWHWWLFSSTPQSVDNTAVSCFHQQECLLVPGMMLLRYHLLRAAEMKIQLLWFLCHQGAQNVLQIFCLTHEWLLNTVKRTDRFSLAGLMNWCLGQTDRHPETPGLQRGNQRWQCTPEAPPETGSLSWWSMHILCFENGRFWLVINKEGNMVTARQEPRLVLISLTCEGDALTLSAAYTKDLQLPIKTPTTNVVHRCR